MSDSTERVPIPPGYSTEIVWEGKSEALLREIVDFWIAHQALPSKEAAEQRAPQVVCVARDSTGALAAVSTIYRQVHPRFGVAFHFFRCFVAPEHRRTSLATLMIYEVTVYLEGRFKAGKDADVLGIFMEIQNEAVHKTMNQAVWPYFAYTYTGKSQRGAMERVYYFPGARI